MSASAIVLIERSSLSRCDRSRLTSQKIPSQVRLDVSEVEVVDVAVCLLILFLHFT